jgi:molybdopterin-guanine dinucleotide biosynthesis protein A
VTVATPQAVPGFVLAGGRSSRMGQDKTQLPWGNGTLLTHAVDRLAQACRPVWICSSHPLSSNALPATVSGYIPDAAEDAGPLGGIVAALEHTRSDWNLILAVDMPFVPVGILQALAARARGPHHVACVLAVGNGRPQPLCGLYSRRLAARLRACLEQGTLKVMEALQQSCGSPTFWLPPDDAGQSADWWRNLNTGADWQAARQAASGSLRPHDSAADAHRLS